MCMCMWRGGGDRNCTGCKTGMRKYGPANLRDGCSALGVGLSQVVSERICCVGLCCFAYQFIFVAMNKKS